MPVFIYLYLLVELIFVNYIHLTIRNDLIQIYMYLIIKTCKVNLY